MCSQGSHLMFLWCLKSHQQPFAKRFETFYRLRHFHFTSVQTVATMCFRAWNCKFSSVIFLCAVDTTINVLNPCFHQLSQITIAKVAATNLWVEDKVLNSIIPATLRGLNFHHQHPMASSHTWCPSSLTMLSLRQWCQTMVHSMQQHPLLNLLRSMELLTSQVAL